jgi:hypothetical protein
MSALDPQAPSQPTQQTGLNQAGNAASKTSAEESSSRDTSSVQHQTIDYRQPNDVPQKHGAKPNSTSLGSGETGPLIEKSIPESDAQGYSRGDSNLDGEQMRAPGEGEVAEAVRQGGGGGHLGQESLTSDLERKRVEHEAELNRRGERTGKEIEEEEKEDWTGKSADIASALTEGREGLGESMRPGVVLAAEE